RDTGFASSAGSLRNIEPPSEKTRPRRCVARLLTYVASDPPPDCRLIDRSEREQNSLCRSFNNCLLPGAIRDSFARRNWCRTHRSSSEACGAMRAARPSLRTTSCDLLVTVNSNPIATLAFVSICIAARFERRTLQSEFEGGDDEGESLGTGRQSTGSKAIAMFDRRNGGPGDRVPL